MGRTAFGEMRDGEAVLLELDGGPFDGRPEEVDLLLLSRLDCEVRCLELPPVAERELPALIRYRLRSVYPASLDRAVVDHVTQHRGAGLVAVVSIMDREALGKLRAAAPRASLGLLAAALLRRPPEAQGSLLCESPGYTELLKFEDGVLLESLLVRRDGQDSLRRIRRLAGSAEVNRLALASLELTRRSVPALFRPARKRHGPRPAVIRAVLAAAALLLGAAVVQRQVGLRGDELSLLRSAILGSQAAGQRTADLAARYSAASGRVSDLLRGRPVDVYQFFADLRDELGPGVLLQDLVLQEGAFQFQATGPSPFALMQRFISDPRFQEVRLLQTTPVGDGSGQQFIVTGRYVK